MEHKRPLLDFSKLTTEQLLYGLALILALGVRFFALGVQPLTESEASWANQALELSRGQAAAIGPQPLYVLFTTFVFWLVRADETWARLLPALCGSLLVVLPLLFRRWVGTSPWARTASILLAFALALDPALVALSRQAGGSMPAIALLWLTLGLAVHRQWRLAGITGGLALLAGPNLLQGVVGLLLCWGVTSLLGRYILELGEPDTGEQEDGETWLEGLRPMLLYAAGTLVIAGTFFLRFPQGLGALASTLPAYLQSWIPGSSDLLPAPALRLPVALLVSQPVAVIFAIIATLRAWLEQSGNQLTSFGKKLGLWTATLLIFAMIYLNRQVADAAWALIPLWALAALELARCLPDEEEKQDLPIIFAHAAITAVFGTLFLYNLLRLSYFEAQIWLYLTILLGIILMIAVISALIAAGWSLNIARLGIAWGITLVLAVSTLSTVWYSAYLAPSSPGDLWGRPPAAGQTAELKQTLGDLSEWHTGLRDQVDVLATVDSAALHWELRGFPNVRYEAGIAANEMPAVLITPTEQTSLNLGVAYRGQDFVWERYPGWSGLWPVQWLDWLYFHKAPAAEQQIILWARSDLFPGGILSTDNTLESPTTYPDEQE